MKEQAGSDAQCPGYTLIQFHMLLPLTDPAVHNTTASQSCYYTKAYILAAWLMDNLLEPVLECLL